jgi:HTH-type transcriptional regulator/antitoxin HigA
LWLDDNSPVIALSIRYDRIDNFWYVLIHELAHIKKRDKNVVDISMLDGDIEDNLLPESEKFANEFAAQFLIDQSKLTNFAHRYYPAFSLVNIVAFAMNNDVHPGIIVGQLHHLGKMYPSHGRKLLVRIKSQITSAAMTDGFGYTIEL